MSAKLHIDLQSHGAESRGAPVRVQVLDGSMRSVREQWSQTPGSLSMDLEPGVYGVRVSVASGLHVEQVAELTPGAETELTVPLYELSPHEGHEWAYFAHSLHEPSSRSLKDPAFEGAWLRLWERDVNGWRPIPVPEGDVQRLTTHADGVTYSFPPPDYRPYVLQTGGIHIPWRCTALPPSHKINVMVKPGDPGTDYPLDVAVSSDDWRVETLLALLQQGDLAGARSWDREASIAEDMLYRKRVDPTAAAVGGYFLLRVRDLPRLHDWAANLADWFEWMADGPIVHAWQLFEQAKAEPERCDELTAQARKRLLEASARSVPLYREGLRLLRDGLLGLYRTSRGEDTEVHAALQRAAAYMAALDPSVSTTTFLAEAPDRPDEASRTGLPEDGEPMMYVFEVPVRELLRERLLNVGEEIRAELGDESEAVEAVVEDDGILRLKDGRSFPTIADLEAEIGVEGIPPQQWTVPARGESLASIADELRRGTFSRTFEEERGLDMMEQG